MLQEIEIITGWDVYRPFAVIHWGRDRNAGHLLGGFHTRQEALFHACNFAREHDCDLPCAEIVSFTKGARS